MADNTDTSGVGLILRFRIFMEFVFVKQKTIIV